MSMIIKLYFITISLSLIYTQQLDNEPNFKVIQSHYLDFPLTKKDFSQWNTIGSAVFLKNRAVLSPETADKKGIMHSTEPNPLTDAWLLDVELNIGSEKKPIRGGTGIGIFYLNNVDKVSHKESIFGYSNRFEGMGIYLNTLLVSSQNDENQATNAIQGYFGDGTKSVNLFSDRQHICYRKYRNLPENQYFKIRIQYEKPLVTVHYYNVFTNQFQFCFSFEADLSYNGYFLLSSSSGARFPDHIYLKSIKLYDTKTIATNEHFQEARHAKAQFEELQNNVAKGVKDLLENKAAEDVHTKDHKNLTEFFTLIPQQHQILQHTIQRVIEESDKSEEKYFGIMKTLPTSGTYNQLMDKIFSIKLIVNEVSNDIEQQNMQLLKFEKELKKVRYVNDIQSGIQRKEVNNPQTKKLYSDIVDLTNKVKQIDSLVQTYANSVNMLYDKILQEEGYTERLADQRRKFAQEQSESILYDMSDIDKIFDELEEDSTNSGMSWSNTIINLGMIAVIFASFYIWMRLKRFESKNA